jgi:hypothetical protein
LLLVLLFSASDGGDDEAVCCFVSLLDLRDDVNGVEDEGTSAGERRSKRINPVCRGCLRPIFAYDGTAVDISKNKIGLDWIGLACCGLWYLNYFIGEKRKKERKKKRQKSERDFCVAVCGGGGVVVVVFRIYFYVKPHKTIILVSFYERKEIVYKLVLKMSRRVATVVDLLYLHLHRDAAGAAGSWRIRVTLIRKRR